MKLINKIKALLGMKVKDYGVSIDNSISLEETPRAYPKVGEDFIVNGPFTYTVSTIDKGTKVVTLTIKDDMDKSFDIPVDIFDELFTPVNPKLNYPL